MAQFHRQASLLGAALSLAGALAIASTVRAQPKPQRRVNLQVLVISTGALDFGTAMVKAGLDETMVPYSEIDLTNLSRARLSEAFLVDTGEPALLRKRVCQVRSALKFDGACQRIKPVDRLQFDKR